MTLKKFSAITLAALLSVTSLISASEDSNIAVSTETAESIPFEAVTNGNDAAVSLSPSTEEASFNTDSSETAEAEEGLLLTPAIGTEASQELPPESVLSEISEASPEEATEEASASFLEFSENLPDTFTEATNELLPVEELTSEEAESSDNAIEDLMNDGEELLTAGEEQALMVSESVSEPNYLHDTLSREATHSARSQSEVVNASLQGLHLDSDGAYRYYLKGKYFMDGSFTVDGNHYYTETNGALVSGWLKTAYTQDLELPDNNDFHFHYRYYDPKTFAYLEGYHIIDGLPHYFQPGSGRLAMNAEVTIDGAYYYCDQYGICSQVRLSYGNTISSEEQQNNDVYLAKNQVTAVDPDTFQGQDGNYSFRPRWYTNRTSSEAFGGASFATQDGICIPLSDSSLKGQVGAVFRNVGQYDGREVDLRLTVHDWEEYSLNGNQELGFFLVSSKLIGVSIANLKNITVNMEFLDHETQSPVTVKGYATFSDIDIVQSLSILSEVEQVYVSSDSVLYKDPDSLTFTAPFEYRRVGNAVNDTMSANWVQANYHSDHLLFRFGSSYDQYRFTYNNLPISTGNYYIWKKDFSGNLTDYSITNTDGSVSQSWQGLYFKRLGMVSLSPLTKRVSDTDELLQTENTLSDREEAFLYTLSHIVPGESSQFYYNTYTIEDSIPGDLLIKESQIQVTDGRKQDVTERFDIQISGQKITIQAKAAWLSKEAFYDVTYHFVIPVQLRDTVDLSSYEGRTWQAQNKGTVSITRNGSSEQQESNPVITYLPVERARLETGEIRLQKVIKRSDIYTSHGDPTFLFFVEGEDEAGNSHRYETTLCFQKSSYTVEEEFAILETVVSNVPLGTYHVTEGSVLDYVLTDLKSLTSNASVSGSPDDNTLQGTVQLTQSSPTAALQFTNQKTTWQGYHHNDVCVNPIPLILPDNS